MKSRSWIWAVLALVVAVLVITLSMQHERTSKSETPVPVVASSSEPKPSAVEMAPSVALPPVQPHEIVDPQFRSWLVKEAEKLDHPNVDSDAKEMEMKDVARKITKPQAEQLYKMATSPSSTAGQKILSAYLMAEGGLNTRAELLKLAKEPLKAPKEFEPHSADEYANTQEKSLKIMALDGLFSQAKNDPRVRETLAREIPSIQDPYVRSYAERRMRELGPQ